MIFNGPIITHDYRRPLAERARSRKSAGPYHRRPCQRTGERHPGFGFYTESAEGTGCCFRMASHGSNADLRLLKVDATSRREYFIGDPDGLDHDSCRFYPVIARLPRQRGFLAGWVMGHGMCGSMDGIIYADEYEAAKAARDEARSTAEAEAEYQSAWQAGRLWAEKREERAALHREALALVKAIKGVPEAAHGLMGALRRVLGAMQEKLDDMAELAAGNGGCGLQFWPNDERLKQAFNEGSDQ